MRIYWLLRYAFVVMALGTANMVEGASATGKTFPTLTIRGTTYTNAIVTEVSSGSVFLRHARGFETFRLETLDAKTLTELGIEAPTARASAPNRVVNPSPDVAPVGAGIASNEVSTTKAALGVVVVGFVILAVLLILIGKVLFIVAAFQTGPWWGVGVLFGGLTCGVVPLIFFFSHLDACKKAFLFFASGVALIGIMAVTSPNFAHAMKSATARERTVPAQ